MANCDAPCSASQKFDWEIRFYQCLLSPHVELADRASEAEGILSERCRRAESPEISAAEREALNDAHEHLRKIQVFELGFPETDGEFAKKDYFLQRSNETEQPSRDLTGRPIPPSERRHLWKIRAK
jgi:hypothetical protein